MIRLEMTDRERNDGSIIITVKNWQDSWSPEDLDEWIKDTYGSGYKRTTLIPPRLPSQRGIFGMGRPKKSYEITVIIRKR